MMGMGMKERPSTTATHYTNTAALGPDLPEGETRRWSEDKVNG